MSSVTSLSLDFGYPLEVKAEPRVRQLLLRRPRLQHAIVTAGLNFGCQRCASVVPAEAVSLCFGSKTRVLYKQGDVHFAKGSVVY